MAIARLLIPLLALAACAVAGAQGPAQPQAPVTGSAQLPPASGGWADSGLVVAEGDRLSFRVQPAGPAFGQLMALPRPAYRARIGDLEFPISPDSRVVAPAAGSLQLEVEYPQSRQFPSRSWPRLTMIVTDEPRPAVVASDPGPGTNVAPIDNRVAGVPGGNKHANPRTAPEDRLTRDGRRRPPRPPHPKGPDWPLIALTAVAVAVALGTALALALKEKGRTAAIAAAPAVTIDPSLDKVEGAVAGDAVVPDGPQVRLRGTLELGEVRFAAGEPAMSGEARDG
jgi:hypothetical protein